MSDKFSELMCSGRQEVRKNDTLVDTEQVNSRKGDKFSIVSKITLLSWQKNHSASFCNS